MNNKFSILNKNVEKLVITRDKELIAIIYPDRIDRYGGVKVKLIPKGESDE